MVFAITGMCFFVCVLFCEGVKARVCFFCFSQGGHRSLLRVVLICQCLVFDGSQYLLFLAPVVIAFYLFGHHHWASNVVSWAHVLIPLLWKLDKFASILVVAL